MTIDPTVITEQPKVTLDGTDRLRVQYDGYEPFAPKLDGWQPFFVARYGFDRTVFTYRKESPCPN